MAKKSAVAKQKRREGIVNANWEQRQQLKKIVKDLNVSEEEKALAREKLNRQPRDACAARLRNRCQLTGRPRGFLRKFQVSRICMRELASFGMIPGMVKASW